MLLDVPQSDDTGIGYDAASNVVNADDTDVVGFYGTTFKRVFDEENNIMWLVLYCIYNKRSNNNI